MYTELFCYHPYLVSMLFADVLSLHLVTFLMFLLFPKVPSESDVETSRALEILRLTFCLLDHILDC